MEGAGSAKSAAASHVTYFSGPPLPLITPLQKNSVWLGDRWATSLFELIEVNNPISKEAFSAELQPSEAWYSHW